MMVFALRPAIDPTMITLPPPLCAMPGITRFASHRLDFTFEFMTLSNASSESPPSGP